jgi:hypothetical protein
MLKEPFTSKTITCLVLALIILLITKYFGNNMIQIVCIKDYCLKLNSKDARNAGVFINGMWCNYVNFSKQQIYECQRWNSNIESTIIVISGVKLIILNKHLFDNFITLSEWRENQINSNFR